MSDFHEVCKAQHERIDRQIDAINSTLLGNGKEGLVTRMSKVEEFVTGAKGDIRELLKFQWKLAGGAIVVNILCSALVGFLIKRL